MPEGDARGRARREHGQAPPAARRRSQEGGIIAKEAPIHLSNVAIADPKDGKPTRVGFKISRTAARSASPSVREI